MKEDDICLFVDYMDELVPCVVLKRQDRHYGLQVFYWNSKYPNGFIGWVPEKNLTRIGTLKDFNAEWDYSTWR